MSCCLVLDYTYTRTFINGEKKVSYVCKLPSYVSGLGMFDWSGQWFSKPWSLLMEFQFIAMVIQTLNTTISIEHLMLHRRMACVPLDDQGL